MSAAVTCGVARELFPAYLDEALPAEERSVVRAHLVACPACRREASALDPALLFAALAVSPDSPAPEVSAADTAKILAAVRSGIALKSAEKRIDSALRSRRHRFAAGRAVMTAAAAVAAVALAWTLAPRNAPERIKPLARVSAPRGDLVLTAPEGGKSFSTFAAASGPADSRGGSVQGRLPADATVYDWNPGGGQPRVVWIVDHSLDI